MNIPFRPIQGSEDIILKQDIYPGHVYFATDSGKIFLDTETERIAVGGGGVAVLYSSAKDIKEDLTDFSYLINKNDFDNNDATPKKDDLIINSDGRFFKVLSFNKDSGIAKCALIAISGTGGGGNTPGDPSQPISGVTLKNAGVSPDAQVYIYGQPQEIKMTATATDDTVITITYTITSSTNANLSASYVSTIYSGQIDTFDLGSKLYKGSNTLKITAVGNNSGSAELRYTTLTSITLALKESSQFNPLKIAYDSNLIFYSIPVGEINKTLKVYLNDSLSAEATYNSTISEQVKELEIPKREHGVYNLKAILSYSTGITEISTTPLLYEVAFVDSTKDAPLIWFKPFPEKITDHDKLTLQFMVYDPININNTTIQRYINDEEITPLEEMAYSETEWITWNISNYKIGKNTFALKCGGTTREIVINVEEDTVRDLEIVTAGLHLNLNSLDRSNKENKTSRETWEYKRPNADPIKVKFNNFNWYNNGWIEDPEIQNSVLRISNGASIEIPLSIMDNKDLSNSISMELRFKLRNVQEYENLIKYTAILDDEGEVESVKKEVISDKGVWCNYYNNGIGMCLGTQEGFFKGSSNIVAGRYKEDQILTVTFVAQSKSEGGAYPLMYMYINGVMSSIVTYTANESFASYANKLVINSDYCDVDLYSIRVYNIGLASNAVVQNYLADMNSAELYDMNQIVSFNNGIPTVDYNKMCEYNIAHPDAPLQPYAVVEVVDGQKSDLLPYKKGIKKNLNVKFVNPALDRAYELGEIDKHTYLCGAPSFEATEAEFDVQGTSSQGYPRRNFKGKFKGASSWKYTSGPLVGQSLNEKINVDGTDYKGFYMDNTFSETTFTWKADFMESSMTHNTGYASFVNTLYSNHPLETYDSSIDVTNRRTTIYGFPMLVFHKRYAPDADGNPVYEFVGRYNFNLDKGCNNVIGFKDNHEHPYVKGTYVNGDNETVPIDYEYISECWELKNNQGNRTSFTYTNFDDVDSNGQLTIHGDFEYRYSYFDDPIDHAIKGTDEFASSSQEARNAFLLDKFKNLETVAEWLKSTDTTPVISQAEHDDPENPAIANELPAAVTYGSGELQVTYTHDTKEYRLAKFANEFLLHFDMHYCAVYFIMTEMILAYDSRGKNMMLGSWGPRDWKRGPDNEPVLDDQGNKIPGDYIWFPIFYDIDTQLGVNNSGVPSWEYYEEATKNGTFSTSSSVLWINFYSCFKNQIMSTYADLRNGNLNYETLYGYYSYNPTFISYEGNDGETHNSYAMRGSRPINVINIDQYWKYIAPTFSGYIDTSGNQAYDYGKRFYCLQGDRDLHRNLFLRNRFNFMDSIWQGGVYDAEGITQQVKVRVNANVEELTSDIYLDRALSEEEIAQGFVQAPYKQNPTDADWTWNITPYLRQYVSIRFDSKLQRDPILYVGDKKPVAARVSDENENSVKITPNFTQQIFYIGGADYISSLGDLSGKYLDEMEFEKMKRLKDLHLGSDIEGYRNGIDIKTFQLGAGKKDAENKGENAFAKTLLESVVLTNVTSLSADMDISGSEKLKEFRAIGTNIAGVTFADGVQLETLYLPNTITYLSLIEPVSLSGLLTQNTPVLNEDGETIKLDSSGYYVFPKGIYLEGITDNADDKTRINNFTITGGQMGYDSYRILKRLVEVKQEMQTADNLGADYSLNLSASLKDVEWTPYRLVISGEAVDASKSYKKITENSTLENYTPDENWAEFTLNQLIYEVDANKDQEKDVINDLSLLDLFLDENNNLKDLEHNYFKDIVDYNDKRLTYPNITGNIFVNNTTPIDEFKIKNFYNVKYPKLNILVNNVNPAYTLKMIEIDAKSGQHIVLETLKYERAEGLSVNLNDITVKPSRLHYDFLGWSLTPDGAVLTDEQVAALTFSEENPVYTLYARFEITDYVATFRDLSTGYKDTVEVEYGKQFAEPDLIPSRDAQESTMELQDRLAFRGWTLNADLNDYVVSESEFMNLAVNPSDYTAEKDYTFYALYVKENAFETPTEDKYFVFTELENGTLKISGNINYQLRGKITLPTSHDEKAITVVGNFSNARLAKHIFFAPNSQYTKIDTAAFGGNISEGDDSIQSTLEGIYLPETINYIGDYAFKGLVSVIHLSDKFYKENEDGYLNDSITYIGQDAFSGKLMQAAKFHINELPQALTKLGARAFYNAGNNITFTKLPKNLSSIPSQAFEFLRNIQITEFGSAASEDVTTPLTFIGQSAFQSFSGTDGANKTVTQIHFYESVTTVEGNAFMSYGRNEKYEDIYPSTVDVYFNNTLTAPDWWNNKETAGFHPDVQPNFRT